MPFVVFVGWETGPTQLATLTAQSVTSPACAAVMNRSSTVKSLSKKNASRLETMGSRSIEHVTCEHLNILFVKVQLKTSTRAERLLLKPESRSTS